MNPRERGFLLLTSHLGNPERRPLTAPQLRTLASRARDIQQEDRELTPRDLYALGYNRTMAAHIVSLLEEEELLDAYLARAKKFGCEPVTRADARYPLLLRRRLGWDSPGCLWARGKISLLDTPAVSLVGSRDIREPNRDFARQLGYQAAKQGLTLVSGNARGADRTAQEACLKAGGKVISVVADELAKQPLLKNILYLSEEDFDAPFTSQRALSRNRVIHCLGRMVFAAQSDLRQGGTWDGTSKNLRFGWSGVACFDDGSEASKELEAMGAYLIGLEDLTDLTALGGENGIL